MQINQNLMDSLCRDAGEERTKKAKKYQRQNRIEIFKLEYENKNNFEVKANVMGSKIYHTYIEVKQGEIENISCTCPDYHNYYGVCKHTLATALELAETTKDMKEDTEKYKDNIIFMPIKQENKYRSFKQIVNHFYQEEMDDIETEEGELKNKGTIRIEPKIFYDKFSGDLKIEFKLGNKRMYKIKDLSEFYTKMMEKDFYRYGERLQFVHTKEMFEENSQKMLEFLMKYAEIIRYANSNSNSNYRYYGKALSEANVVLGNTGIDELFEVLEGKKVEFQKDMSTELVEFVNKDPDINFILEKKAPGEYKISPTIEIFKVIIFKGRNHQYILEGNQFHRCSRQFEKANLKLLEIFRQNYLSEVLLSQEDLDSFFSIIMPKAKNAIFFKDLEEEIIKKYKPKELGIKVFLDFDKNNYLVSEVKFCYEENEFNPLDEKIKLAFPRNKIQETKALNVFRKTGFMLDTKNLRFILPDSDKIYEFLTEDIQYYMQKFEVLVTENFKTKQIVKPKIGSLGVKVENNLLSINFSQLNIDSSEIQEIMQKYKLKKKYHRLKNGVFMDLEENEEISFLDKLVTGMDLEYKDLEKEEIQLPVSRTLYLNQLLKGIKGTEILKNQEYRHIIKGLNKETLEEEITIPNKLETTLRYYQKTGVKWLKGLDLYHFGGILADDMGLGKTIQMLSILLDYQESNAEKKRASIVISPSSLTLNWLNEAQKFAPTLKVQVIRGTANERKRQIEELEKYDLIITSYDLLKRDIELYKKRNYIFRFVIADEAQYLKNSNTQNAKAIKEIKADTRYALTGTPIENSLAELWSIFDFIMPGYLFTYRKFKTMYEIPIIRDQDEKAMYKLKMLIEPFVLRRTKKEVLKELPDKTVTVLENEMEEEQKNIYLSYLAQAKQEVAEEIDMKGYEKSQIKILTALTRLRQICCHPGLFMDHYQAGSSKLEQCMEIIEDATNSDHKILVFSSYTSMFALLEEELKNRKIEYFKLTGATKVDERIELVDEFNENPNIKVFLISLKAGGTGLNLTGADMVIHYDPWWNLSAENQATDRAYRIGQTNNVQVYKLITKNSIEEKIYDLQQKKAELMDQMLSTKTTFVNKLSKEDIMSLFD